MSDRENETRLDEWSEKMHPAFLRAGGAEGEGGG